MEKMKQLNELEPRTIWSIEMRDLLEKLRATYAPTIEMTKFQYEFMNNNKLIIDVVGKVTVDGLVKDYFDKRFWYPLTQEQVVQAWLHPGTIKVVE